jgi:hypothetical protein
MFKLNTLQSFYFRKNVIKVLINFLVKSIIYQHNSFNEYVVKHVIVLSSQGGKKTDTSIPQNNYLSTKM